MNLKTLGQNKTYFGLSDNVIFCKRCVMSNQRPASMAEFRHVKERKNAKYLHIDQTGVCDACHYAEKKQEIDWKIREDQLLKLLDKFRRKDGAYDCIVPGSGGKDSGYASHILKYKYGMHPLTVTWPPILYTQYGYENFRNWIEIGSFDNISFKPSGKAHKLLTKLAIENLLHPFQTFILGQKNLAPKIAIQYQIPLIFYGEPEAEYGNPISETSSSLRNKNYYSVQDFSDVCLSGIPISELTSKYGLTLNDLNPYLPASNLDLENTHIEIHYLGFYLKWTPQEAYYYAVEHAGFRARPFRSEGTYSKYSSIDDKIDDLHYYTTYIKFGLGRASYDASQEIRNKHITREEAIALVRKFDGEFPERYFYDVMTYLEIKPEYFHELCDQFRSPHLWKMENGKWKLRYQVK